MLKKKIKKKIKKILNNKFLIKNISDLYSWVKVDEFSYFLRNEDSNSKMLLSDNGYEPHLIKIFKKLINPNEEIIDLGANIGIHTLFFSKLVGDKGRVVSIEPQKEIFYQLCTNLLLNNIKNVDALNYACTNEQNLYYEMEEIDWSNSGNSKIQKKHKNRIKSNYIRSIRLDDLDISPSLIKIDVQGSELNVLKGGFNLINKCRPIIIIEIEEHHLQEFNTSSKELLNELLSMDYVVYRIMNEYPCDHIAVPVEKDTYDFQQITNHNVNLIDRKIKKLSIKWPLYDQIIE